MGALPQDPADLWDELRDAISDSISDAEGHVSVFYLQHHLQKAGLGVHRLSDEPHGIAHDMLAGALSDLCATFTERTGEKRPYAFIESKFCTVKKPEYTVYISAGRTNVIAHTHDAPSLDAAIDLAQKRVAALRTYEDECADLGIAPAAQIEEAA